MQNMKMYWHILHRYDRHENAGHENAGHEIAGHENAKLKFHASNFVRLFHVQHFQSSHRNSTDIENMHRPIVLTC